MSKKKLAYVPDRGDVVWLTLDPQSGHEQAGRRPVLTLTTAEYNRIGLGVFCPITNKAKGYPFEVPLPPGPVTGVALADQAKSLDWKSRQAEFFSQVDEDLVDEVVGRVIALIDPNNVYGTGGSSGHE
jgi:mRNA interferase MazF